MLLGKGRSNKERKVNEGRNQVLGKARRGAVQGREALPLEQEGTSVDTVAPSHRLFLPYTDNISPPATTSPLTLLIYKFSLFNLTIQIMNTFSSYKKY